jgi:hypothetical protein
MTELTFLVEDWEDSVSKRDLYRWEPLLWMITQEMKSNLWRRHECWNDKVDMILSLLATLKEEMFITAETTDRDWEIWEALNGGVVQACR